MAKLKPCPFCDRADAPIIAKDGPYQICGSRITNWYVFCQNCGSRGPEEFRKQQAIDAWNKRS